MKTFPHVPTCQKAYKSYRISFLFVFFEKVKMQKSFLYGLGLCVGR